MRVVFDTNICALDGKADLIVTGDKKILDLREYKGVRIVRLRI